MVRGQQLPTPILVLLSNLLLGDQQSTYWRIYLDSQTPESGHVPEVDHSSSSNVNQSIDSDVQSFLANTEPFSWSRHFSHWNSKLNLSCLQEPATKPPLQPEPQQPSPHHHAINFKTVCNIILPATHVSKWSLLAVQNCPTLRGLHAMKLSL